MNIICDERYTFIGYFSYDGTTLGKIYWDDWFDKKVYLLFGDYL